MLETLSEPKILQSLPDSHCCNLYATSLLKQNTLLYDTELDVGQDQVFQAQALVAAHRTTIVEAPVYHYHAYRSTSVTGANPNLKVLHDDLAHRVRVRELLYNAGFEAMANQLLTEWSYSINTYWIKAARYLSLPDCVGFFDTFRATIRQLQLTPWLDSTPERNRKLLELILDGQIKKAVEALSLR